MAALMVAGACSTGSPIARPSQARILDAGNPIAGLWLSSGASPSGLTTFAAASVRPDSTYWAGLSAIEVTGPPVEVVSARGVTDTRIESSDVFVGRQGIDGAPGATPDTFPRSQSTTGSPSPAAGYTLVAESGPYVVYVRATVGSDLVAAHIYGAELQVRTAAGDVEELFVLSPVTLCAAIDPDDPNCRREEERMIASLGLNG